MPTTNTLPTGEIERLIDQRLDTIDRALLGLIPRQHRLSIVTQVESQLRELAVVSSANTTDDPQVTVAEAHFGDAGGAGAAGRRNFSARRKQSRLALSSGVLGIVALALLFALPITYLVVANANMIEEVAEVLLGTHLAAVALGGTLAVVLGAAGLLRLQSRKRQMAGSGWAITGLCTGPLPMFVGGLLVLVVGLQLFAEGRATAVSITTTSAPVMVPVPDMLPPPSVSSPAYCPGPQATLASQPEGWIAPAAYPAPVCEKEVSESVVEAPLQDAGYGSPRFADSSEASPAEAAAPLEPTSTAHPASEPPPQIVE